MRRMALLVAVGTAAFLSACQTAADSPAISEPSTTSLATASPEATRTIAPTATATTSATPSAAASIPAEEAEFGFNDVLRVEVNGLAVRAAPYPHMPLAVGWTFDAANAPVNLGEVRLNAGDFVSIDLGPLHIGDTTWYRVWPAEDGVLHYSTISWDTKNDGANPVEPGWIAAGVGTDAYLTLHEAFEPDPWRSGLPLLVAGSGGYVSDPLENFDLFSLDWVYLIDDQLAPCEFTVTLEPGSGDPGVVAVARSTIGAFEAGVESLGTASRVPVVGDTFDPFRLRVESGCEWALRLEPLPHD